MNHFISLDVGTTSVKVSIFNSKGEMLALAVREYTLYTPAENIVELDPEVYWKCCCEGIRHVLRKSKVPAKDIISIGICSQGETLIILDKNGAPLRKAIVWMDNRSFKEAEELKSVFGTENNSGQADIQATWPVTKILWLKKNQPEIFGKAYKYLLVEDYIIYRLTGKFIGEYSLYSSSLMLDIVNKKWWKELLDYTGITEDSLVELRESGEIAGTLSALAARKLGLNPDTKVVTGAMDQVSGMVGAGNIKNGIITETTGAALAICGTIDSFPEKRSKTEAVQYHAVPDKYMLIGWCPTGGMALKWLRDAFFEAEKKKLSKSGKDTYDYMTAIAGKIPSGSQGLVFLPYLAGPGTADISPEARGVFYGLELHHSRPHFVRALLESVVYILRSNIEDMEKQGVSCGAIRSLGGGSKSRLWNRLKADITGKPVMTMKCSETTSLGTAILQAKATGTYRTLDEAVERMVRFSSEIKPDKNSSKKYNDLYNEFLDLNNKIFPRTLSHP